MKFRVVVVAAIGGMLSVCACLLGASVAKADTCSTYSNTCVTYFYTGNDYTSTFNQFLPGYTTSMNVTGSITFTAPLPADLPLTDINVLPVFSVPTFFDGLHTIIHFPLPLTFQVGTDAFGNIDQWNILAGDDPPIAVNVGTTYLVVSISDTTGDSANFSMCTAVTTVPPAPLIRCTASVADTASVNEPGSWSATPLPAALPLFATGIGGLGLLGWRRKRKAQARAA
jgi:hypothetical protein